MRKLSILLVIAPLTLVGCASTSYQAYADAQVAVAAAHAKAEVERYRALAEIAKTGDSAARVAAVMSLNQQPQKSQAPTGLRAPETAGDLALKWTSVLLPSVTQLYSIGKSADLGIVNSNNNLEGKKSDNGMIVDLVQGRPTPIVGNRTGSDGSTEDFLLYPR